MSYQYMVNFLMLFLMLFLGFVMFFLIRAYLQIKQKKQREVIVGGRKKKSAKLFTVYKFVSRFKLTRGFIRRLVKIYSIRLPGDYRRAREEATLNALIMWGVSTVFFAGAIIFNASVYGLSCAGLLSYVVCKGITTTIMERYDLRIIQELNEFIDDVRHYYYDTKMVDESIREAVKHTKTTLMKQHAQKIYEVITADDLMEAAKKYNASAGDYFLKKFMVTALTIEQYGDRTIDDESLFLSSLRDLKQDIQTEMRKRRAIKSAFSFLAGISVFPYFMLDVISSFGTESFSSLKDIYDGSYGSIAKLILFIFSIIIYQMVNRLRETLQVQEENTNILRAVYKFPPFKRVVHNILNRNWGKSLRLRTLLKKTGNTLNIYLFTTKRLIYAIAGFAFIVIFMLGMHIHTKQVYSQGQITMANSTSGASDTEMFEMLILCRYYMDEYLNVDVRSAYNSISGAGTQTFDSDVESYLENIIISRLATEGVVVDEEEAFNLVPQFLEEFSGTTLNIQNLDGLTYREALTTSDSMVRSGMTTLRKMIRDVSKANCFESNTDLSSEVASTVASRIKKVQNEYFKWYDLIFAVIFAVAAYLEPYIIIMVERKSLQMDMMDEVIQFESVIMILMYIERMTVEEILDWMCMFSRVFKTSLQTCICHYPLDDFAALDQLIEDEPFEAFRRLIENLKVCDRVGVRTAFMSLSSERKNYQEERKQENEITTESKSSLGKFVAFLPFYAAVIVYMVIPYGVAAVGDLTSSMSAMSAASASS